MVWAALSLFLLAAQPIVVIDAGHGGRHHGATGVCGVKEKEVTLAIAKELAEVLRAQSNCIVLMTREADRFVDLRARAMQANGAGAAMMVSIHANSSPDSSHHGVETFFAALREVPRAKSKPATPHARRIALRENEDAAEEDDALPTLQTILSELTNNYTQQESQALAFSLHRALTSDAPRRRRGVLQAPFYVLTQTKLPAALVEVGYLTHPDECAQLSSSARQRGIAKQLAAGIDDFLTKRLREETNRSLVSASATLTSLR